MITGITNTVIHTNHVNTQLFTILSKSPSKLPTAVHRIRQRRSIHELGQECPGGCVHFERISGYRCSVIVIYAISITFIFWLRDERISCNCISPTIISNDLINGMWPCSPKWVLGRKHTQSHLDSIIRQNRKWPLQGCSCTLSYWHVHLDLILVAHTFEEKSRAQFSSFRDLEYGENSRLP